MGRRIFDAPPAAGAPPLDPIYRIVDITFTGNELSPKKFVIIHCPTMSGIQYIIISNSREVRGLFEIRTSKMEICNNYTWLLREKSKLRQVYPTNSSMISQKYLVSNIVGNNVTSSRITTRFPSDDAPASENLDAPLLVCPTACLSISTV